MKKTMLAVSAGMIALSACATPPVAVLPDGTSLVGRSFTPGPEDGSVTVECVVAQDRALSACIVISENPSGQGFGRAALDVAQRGRAPDGRGRAGDKVRLTTRFRLVD